MRQAYPVMLEVTGRTIVIVGGGAVAARKARGLLEAGATRICCVAKDFCDEMPSQVERVPEAYRPGHLDGADLVFAATDRPEVNDAIVQDAHARHLLVNRADADEQEPGDFAVPANLRRGDVVISVSAASPALSVLIRDQLAGSFDPRWERMAAAMQALRPLIKAVGLEIAGRRRIFRELAGEEALNVLQDRGPDGLRQWLLDRHPELTHA